MKTLLKEEKHYKFIKHLNLSESFCGLADKAGKLFEAEYRDQMSKSYFIDHADANGFKYTESGVMV